MLWVRSLWQAFQVEALFSRLLCSLFSAVLCCVHRGGRDLDALKTFVEEQASELLVETTE